MSKRMEKWTGNLLPEQKACSSNSAHGLVSLRFVAGITNTGAIRRMKGKSLRFARDDGLRGGDLRLNPARGEVPLRFASEIIKNRHNHIQTSLLKHQCKAGLFFPKAFKKLFRPGKNKNKNLHKVFDCSYSK